MADQKITQLPEETDPQPTDLVVIVSDPEGTPVNRKVEIGNLPSGDSFPYTIPTTDTVISTVVSSLVWTFGPTLRIAGPDGADGSGAFELLAGEQDYSGPVAVTAGESIVDDDRFQAYVNVYADDGAGKNPSVEMEARVEEGVQTARVTVGNVESPRIEIRATDTAAFFILSDPPEIPATPNAQDIADVLVALGLATQAP